MNIIYLTWGETPRSYGVFMSQVINQLISTKEKMPESQFHMVSGLPIIHSGLIREKNYKNEIKNIKKALKDIPFTIIPIYAPQNFVNSNKYTFNLLHGISHKKLSLLIQKIQPEIIHCRSYHASWAALKIKERLKLSYKIIFDGRDLWPEEMALKKNHNKSSSSYLFLKDIEKQIITKCNASVSVTEEMHNHYEQIGAINDHCIHISTNTQLLSSKKPTNSVNNESTNFCYIGALSEDTWHKPTQLAFTFKKIKTMYPNARLTIITTSNHDHISNIFIKHKINDFSLTQTKSIEQLAEILSSQQIGIISYFIPENDLQIKLGSILLSIKAVEYLAAGVPIICNKYCGGIARIIEDHQVGINYNPNTYAEINQENIQKILNKETKERAIILAKKLFEYKENATRYVNLYKQLIDDKPRKNT